MNEILDSKHALLAKRTGGSRTAELVMALLTTARMIDAECGKLLAQHGLSEGRFAALLAVSDTPAITPAELASLIGVTRATTTGLIEGLVVAGLVNRANDVNDRRLLRLNTTPAGDELVERLVPEYRAWLEHLTRGIEEQESAMSMRVLAALQRKVTAHA